MTSYPVEGWPKISEHPVSHALVLESLINIVPSLYMHHNDCRCTLKSEEKTVMIIRFQNMFHWVFFADGDVVMSSKTSRQIQLAQQCVDRMVVLIEHLGKVHVYLLLFDNHR